MSALIARILGGLGNQLFQYAAARRLSIRRNIPLKLDISAFKNYQLREYSLQHFCVDAEIAGEGELSEFTSTNAFSRMSRWLDRFRTASSMRLIREPFIGPYVPDLERYSGARYMSGFWQSEKYFSDVDVEIRRDFQFRKPADPENSKWSDQLRSCESVSVHVRRGDYANNPATREVHGLCSLDYYRAAARHVCEIASKPEFFVFSDDPDWVERELGLGVRFSTMKHNPREKDYEDLRLMSNCKYHIIANSTFSWWGAWLSTVEGKVVIAPRKWMATGAFDTRDIVPSGWTTI